MVSSGEVPLVGPVSSAQIIQLAIMLPLRNQSTLTALLQQIHDPSSPEYRHFLSAYQFTEQFGPAADDYQKVVQFAQANGFTVVDTPSNRLVVFVSAPVAAVEQAFHVKMNFYQDPAEGTYTVWGGPPDPTIYFTQTLYDSTPGAEIYWQVDGCSGSTSGQSPVTSGGEFTLVYNPQYNCNPSGTMYAVAPGYAQSATVPIAF